MTGYAKKTAGGAPRPAATLTRLDAPRRLREDRGAPPPAAVHTATRTTHYTRDPDPHATHTALAVSHWASL